VLSAETFIIIIFFNLPFWQRAPTMSGAHEGKESILFVSYWNLGIYVRGSCSWRRLHPPRRTTSWWTRRQAPGVLSPPFSFAGLSGKKVAYFLAKTLIPPLPPEGMRRHHLVGLPVRPSKKESMKRKDMRRRPL
jgi:hypothetical protein